MSGLRDKLNFFQGFGKKFLEDHRYEIGQYFLGLAEAAVCLDQLAYSTRLLGALDGLRENWMGWWGDINPEKVNRVSESARSRMDQRDFQIAWEEGQAMSLEQAVEYALEIKIE